MEKSSSRDEQEENDGEKGKDPQWVRGVQKNRKTE